MHSLCSCSAMEQRIASGRRDLFRTRKQNTSRPPSMHVDDFMAKVKYMYDTLQNFSSKYLKCAFFYRAVEGRWWIVVLTCQGVRTFPPSCLNRVYHHLCPPWGVVDGWVVLCPLLGSATSEGWGELGRGIHACLTRSSRPVWSTQQWGKSHDILLLP